MKLPAQFFLLCRDGALPKHDLDGIPRQKVDQQENDGYHSEYNGDRSQEAAEKILSHCRTPVKGVGEPVTIRIARTGV